MARTTSAVCLLLLVALSAVYEVQGTFLLRHYLRKFPRGNRDIQPFACKGMMRFMNVLELRCPLKPEYRSFFGKLRSFMSFISSARGSKNFDVELKGQAQGLQSAMAALSGTGGSSADTSKVLSTLMTMGKTLGQQNMGGSTEMTLSQRKELIVSMVQWARVIGQFVSSVASKGGSTIDMSSLGLDGIDASVSSPTTGATGSADTSSATSTTAATGNGATESATATGNGATDSATTSTQSTNGGCTSSACGGGAATGGNSFKGSINYQSGTQSSQQTAGGSS